jgi:starch-binding outer membrane protein, SusD/RagB family
MKKYIIPILLIFVVASCNDDFLERYPLSDVSPQTYFKTENELSTYINSLYSYLPAESDIFRGDNQSDNLATKSYNTVVAGQHQVQTDAGAAGWGWDYLRDVNFFLENYSIADISPEAKNHYAGIAKFFRAWFYFDKVKRFGDVPWYGKTIQTGDEELLYKARDSREMVMDSVLADINFACENIYASTPGNTIDKWSALALKSRIGLYEGTLRKYHGLADGEKFMRASLDASNEIMQGGGFSLYSTGNPNEDYQNLFLLEDANANEMILARVYNDGLTVWHTANGNFLTGTLSAPGLTKSLVNTYLMTDGTPFTDLPGHDTMMFVGETQNRDPRLAQTIRTPGYTRVNGTQVLSPDFDNARTGYQIIKFVQDNSHDGYNTNTNDLPIFRYAEVLLNYAEAKAELGELTQGDIDASINLIRQRVGMPNMALGTLTVDPVLEGRYNNVDGALKAAILEIRRERRVELAVEGFRYDDLVRWHVADLMAEPFKGMYFPSTGMFDVDGDGADDIALVEDVPAETVPGILYLDLGSGFDIDNGDNGNIVMHPDIVKVFEDPKHYLFPLPRTELLLNDKLTQNPGWDE